ncbi:MAG: chemotaxis protein CheW [Spongiibacteraceae bacterium]|nr:chemotaxis protein CheW [Spongiibacteraceae bacterium]
MNSQLEPFAALLDIAERSVRNAKGLPAQVDIKPYWSGIGFTLAGHRFVAPMGEVAEILAQPPSTHLSGVQPWVVGVSNVRGRLLPLIDFENFFGSSLGSRKRRRVLVLEMGELYSGLIVSEVFGMQHMPVDCFTDTVTDVVEKLKPFLAGSYHHDGVTWSVFSPFKLTNDAEFFNAAAS